MKSFRSIFSKTVFVALFLFASGNLLLAQVQRVAIAAAGADCLVEFTGQSGDMLVFEVQLDHLPVKGTVLTISDNQDNILLEEKINTVNHSRRYKIVRNTMELITFKVSGKIFSCNQSFSINYRVEEKLEVKKVK